MNAQRRKDIASILKKIDELDALRCEIVELIGEVRDEEQDYRDNMPESFANGEKGDRADEVVGALEEAANRLEEFDLIEVGNNLEEAAA